MISRVKRRHKMWNPFELSFQSHKGPDLLLTPINSELIYTILIVDIIMINLHLIKN